MHPNSISLVVALFVIAVLALVAIARWKHLVVRIVAGIIAVAFSASAGIAIVNDYYGYYQSWGEVSQDFSGSYTAFNSTPTTQRHVAPTRSGQVVSMTFAGSGLSRQGLVYLPPEYDQPRYAHDRFPVVELLHGTPGEPADWVDQLGVASLMNRMIAHHLVGPMILVIPTMTANTPYEECVNGPYAQDDSYITTSVREDLERSFRVADDAEQWGIGGFSSGGYCAANLAMRHRSDFGAAGIMDGYFRPQDGPAAKALGYNRAAEDANNPLLLARRLTVGTAPLPSFWMSAGTGDPADITAATAFAHALHGIEGTTLYREPGAGHNFYAWRPAVPRMLAWMWTQLASPQQRVQFPIAGGFHNAVITGGAHHVRHSTKPGSHSASARPSAHPSTHRSPSASHSGTPTAPGSSVHPSPSHHSTPTSHPSPSPTPSPSHSG